VLGMLDDYLCFIVLLSRAMSIATLLSVLGGYFLCPKRDYKETIEQFAMKTFV